MQADAGTSISSDVLTILREATGPAHERLDTSFGELSLAHRADLAQFLSAHAIGLAPLFPVFRDYVENTLAMVCPDYPGMLRADLAALGVDVDDLPRLEVPAQIARDQAAGGVAYVVCGSRLGLTVIRQQGYWGEPEGFRSAYMSDGQGHAAWKALVPKLRRPPFTSQEAQALREAALAAFDTFARGFAASAGQRANG